MNPYAPDLVEPLVGWRTWDLKGTGPQRTHLHSPQMGTHWPKYGPLIAACSRSAAEDSIYYGYEEVHNDHCQCGVNAFIDKDETLRKGYLQKGRALGEVSLWGNVREFERGYRADYGYPKKLYAAWPQDVESVKNAAAAYGAEYGGLVKPKYSLLAHLAGSIATTLGLLMILLYIAALCITPWICMIYLLSGGFLGDVAGQTLSIIGQGTLGFFMLAPLVALMRQYAASSKKKWKIILPKD